MVHPRIKARDGFKHGSLLSGNYWLARGQLSAAINTDFPLPEPIRVFDAGVIVVHLAESFGAFLPAGRAARAECFSWLMWQMSTAPILGGGFG
jgi:hypothetical protein